MMSCEGFEGHHVVPGRPASLDDRDCMALCVEVQLMLNPPLFTCLQFEPPAIL